MTHFIVGLGNPEPEYVNTRHNAGRRVLDVARSEWNSTEWRKRKDLKARLSESTYKGFEIIFIEPDNYMNNSGYSLLRMDLSREEIDHIIIVHDDIDLPLGTLRISHNKGAGGHNGVKSIIEHLKTKKFTRIRIGIAPVSFFGSLKKPKGDKAVQKYVLGTFTKREAGIIDTIAIEARQAIEMILEEDVYIAMNAFNTEIK